MPKRGALALVTTVLAVVLLFNFKTSDTATLAASIPSNAAVGPACPDHARSGRHRTGSNRRRRRASRPTSPADPGRPPRLLRRRPARRRASRAHFTGAAVNTPYGTVQIAIVEQGGQIVDVQELQMPFDRRLSAQISQEAGPLLRQQVLRAQSANINGVSGASYTSYGYYQSLISALSQAQ